MLAWMLQQLLARCVVCRRCPCSGVPGQVVAWLLLMRKQQLVLSAWA
jgi:hypothetical protein